MGFANWEVKNENYFLVIADFISNIWPICYEKLASSARQRQITTSFAQISEPAKIGCGAIRNDCGLLYVCLSNKSSREYP